MAPSGAEKGCAACRAHAMSTGRPIGNVKVGDPGTIRSCIWTKPILASVSAGICGHDEALGREATSESILCLVRHSCSLSKDGHLVPKPGGLRPSQSSPGRHDYNPADLFCSARGQWLRAEGLHQYSSHRSSSHSRSRTGWRQIGLTSANTVAHGDFQLQPSCQVVRPRHPRAGSLATNTG